LLEIYKLVPSLLRRFEVSSHSSVRDIEYTVHMLMSCLPSFRSRIQS
jgi:hypothetical protein